MTASDKTKDGGSHTPGPWEAALRPSSMWHIHGADGGAVCFTGATHSERAIARKAAPASDTTARYEPEASEPKDAARRDEGGE